MTQRALLRDPGVSQQEGTDVGQELQHFFSELHVWRGHERLKQERDDAHMLARLDAMVAVMRTRVGP